MFGWDFENSKSDPIKLFLFILAVFLVVGSPLRRFSATRTKQKSQPLKPNRQRIRLNRVIQSLCFLITRNRQF